MHISATYGAEVTYLFGNTFEDDGPVLSVCNILVCKILVCNILVCKILVCNILVCNILVCNILVLTSTRSKTWLCMYVGIWIFKLQFECLDIGSNGGLLN